MPVLNFNLSWRLSTAYVGGGHEVVDVNTAGVAYLNLILDATKRNGGDYYLAKQQAVRIFLRGFL